MLCFLLVTDAWGFISNFRIFCALHITSPSTLHLHISSLHLLLWHITFTLLSSGVRMSWREWWLLHQRILSSWWLLFFYYFVYCTLYQSCASVPLKIYYSNHFIIVQLGEAVSQLPVWAVVLLVAALAVIAIIAGAVAFMHRERITDLTDRLRLNWLVFVCFVLYVGEQFFKFWA